MTEMSHSNVKADDFVGTTLLPIAPLLLTIVSAEELLKRFVSIAL